MKYSKQAGGSTNRMEYILETERDWIRRAKIKIIQDKVIKFEEQLGNVNSENSFTDQQYCPSISEVNNGIDKDEDLNVFEVEPSNFCHTALVYNDDGEEVDEHGNTQWVSSAKKSLQDGEYMINPIRLGLPKTVRVVSLILKFHERFKETK